MADKSPDQIYRELLTREPAPVGDNPFGIVARNFVYGDVWARPGLARRERRLVSLAPAANAGAGLPVDTHIYGALNTGDVEIAELMEYCLHFAVYIDFQKAVDLEEACVRLWAQIQEERGEPAPAPWPRLATHRLDEVAEHVRQHSHMSSKDRRIVTIACLGITNAKSALRDCVAATVSSGDLTAEELDQLVLQYALYAGFPRGAALSGLLSEARAAPS
jgi:4-carboxymuconolactone decarboxylase